MPSNITRGNVEGLLAVSIRITPTAVSAWTSAEQSFTVQGLLVTDIVIRATMPAAGAGISIFNVRVKAMNTVAITFANVTSASHSPAPGTYILILGRLSDSALLKTAYFS
jgi:hypothetical protein